MVLARVARVAPILVRAIVIKVALLLVVAVQVALGAANPVWVGV